MEYGLTELLLVSGVGINKSSDLGWFLSFLLFAPTIIAGPFFGVVIDR